MKRKPKVPKGRNPFVAHLATKRSGPHGKTNKALRRAEKVKLMDLRALLVGSNRLLTGSLMLRGFDSHQDLHYFDDTLA
jgi:hypothetical protein